DDAAQPKLRVVCSSLCSISRVPASVCAGSRAKGRRSGLVFSRNNQPSLKTKSRKRPAAAKTSEGAADDRSMARAEEARRKQARGGRSGCRVSNRRSVQARSDCKSERVSVRDQPAGRKGWRGSVSGSSNQRRQELRFAKSGIRGSELLC